MKNKEKSTEVIFVYSESQVEEENTICAKVGKQFTPGKVFFGSSSKDYSKKIKPENLKAMVTQYPDTKIVGQGDKSQFKYTPPKKELM